MYCVPTVVITVHGSCYLGGCIYNLDYLIAVIPLCCCFLYAGMTRTEMSFQVFSWDGNTARLNSFSEVCFSILLDAKLTFERLLVTWWTNSLTFNNCTFCPHCIYVFCICLRTNSNLCHLQYKLTGFYNRDEKCLLRGTNWVFK